MTERRDKRQNRDRILNAAEAVFGEMGVDASTEQVAVRAEVGVATVFRHFATKHALIQAVVLHRFQRLVEEVRGLCNGQDPAAIFTAFTLLLGEARRKRIIGDVMTDAATDVGASYAGSLAELWEALSVLLARGQQAKLVRTDVDVLDVRALLAGAHHALQSADGDLAREHRLMTMMANAFRDEAPMPELRSTSIAGSDRSPR